jgi:hypothetical protein
MSPAVARRIREAAKRTAAAWPSPTAEEVTWLRETLGPLTYEDIVRLRGRAK